MERFAGEGMPGGVLEVGSEGCWQDGPGERFGVAFSPDSRTLAAGTYNGTVLLSNIARHTQPASLSTGTNNDVDSVAFSPDGRTLATGTGDGTVLLWDTGTHAQLMSVSVAVATTVSGVAFSPEGRTLAVGAGDGAVSIMPGDGWRSFAALRDEICGIVPGGLSRADWHTYAPGLTYENDCHTR